jgi:hypothetical protein
MLKGANSSATQCTSCMVSIHRQCLQDGLLFLNKASVYTPGPTPLVLHWSDATCSSKLNHQLESPYLAILELGFDGKLTTHDCVELLDASPDDIRTHGLSPGDLLRFEAEDAFVDSVSGCAPTSSHVVMTVYQ